MSNNLKNGLLGTTALVGAEAFSGGIGNGAISSIIGHTANAVQYGLGNLGNSNHLLEQGASFIGADAPLAHSVSETLGSFILPGTLGLGSAYMGWKKYQEEGGIKGFISGIEKSTLSYGVAGAVGGGIGLLSAPFFAPILATGLSIYGVKKLAPAIAHAANENVSKINPMSLLNKNKAA